MTSSARSRSLDAIRLPRLTLADAAVVIVATKPLLDALSERTREVRFDLGSTWTLLALLLLVVDLLRSYRVPLAAWALRIAASVLVGVGVLRGLVEQNPTIALEWARVAAGLAPAAILLGAWVRGSLPTVMWRWRLLFAASIGLHASVAWLQFFGIVGTTYQQAGVGRPSGLFYHPITLGYLLVAVMVFLAVRSARGGMPRWIALLTASVAYVTIIVTTHRTSFIVGSFVLVAWALLTALRTRRVRLAVVTAASVGLVLAASIGALTFPSWSGTATRAVAGLSNVITAEDLDLTSDRFLRGRGQRWMNALSLIESGGTAEWLFGFGYEAVDPHSDYIRLPLVHGVLGSLVVLIGLAAFWVAVLRLADGPSRWWLIILIAAMALFAVTAKPTSYPSFMWAWTIVALVTTAPERATRSAHGIG